MEQLLNLEIALHQHDTRSNLSRIDQLIHSSFIEIGYSENTYSKKEILNLLLSEAEPTYTVWSQDYQLINY